MESTRIRLKTYRADVPFDRSVMGKPCLESGKGLGRREAGNGALAGLEPDASSFFSWSRASCTCSRRTRKN